MLQGLSAIKTPDLKRLLSFLYKEELQCPLTPQRIACVGFQYKQEELMGALRGLDATAVQAVLVCVLAERRQQEGKKFYTQK